MIPIPPKEPELGRYSVAPYNFVSLPDKAVARYINPKELPAHNNFKNREGKDLLSGSIEYSLRAETPIMVAAGDKDKSDEEKANKDVFFFKNHDGAYAIPGNTMRGILRTNSQILSFSNIIKADDSKGYLESEVEDAKFLFRDIAGGNALTKKYSSILAIDRNKRISKNLRAGYMYNDGKKYYIEESEKLNDIRNYFRLDEIYLRKVMDRDIKNKVRFMYTERLIEYDEEIKGLNKMMALTNKATTNEEKRIARNKRLSILRKPEIKNEINYEPYNLEISFSFDKKTGRITSVGQRGRYPKEGYLLSGGHIDGKLAHYIVPAPDGSSRLEVSQDNIVQYKDDLILTKKMDKSTEKIKNGSEFFDLPQGGSIKPIFFINTDRMHFGFTPNLRMFYSKSILDGIRPSYKDVRGISYTDSIFGFTNMVFEGDKYSYKSRVSFEDAVADEDAKVDEDSTMQMLLAEPKATSYNLYLEQKIDTDKENLNIYDGDFKIRGFKQYWLKKYIERPDIGNATNMAFNIHPLKEGTEFTGKIHFTNLEEDELGLILWALKLEDNCYQGIGLAKPYGFGRVKLSNIELKVENLDKKYKEFSFDFMDTASVDDYISIYKDRFSKTYLNGKNIEEEKPIKELLCIKSTLVETDDSNWYRYMKLRYNERNLKEFSSKKVLPPILEYANLIKQKSQPRGSGYNRQGQYNRSSKNQPPYGKSNNRPSNKDHNPKNTSKNTGNKADRRSGSFNNTLADSKELQKLMDKFNKR